MHLQSPSKNFQKKEDKYEVANIIIFGDMNLKFIDWTTETLRRPANITQTISTEEKTSSHILLDFVNENLLFQMVTENTRKGKTLLDIILQIKDKKYSK